MRYVTQADASAWTPWMTNPFQAIKAAAEQAARPELFCAAVSILGESTRWENFDADDYLDDLLQEIAGHTNIVCQYEKIGLTTRYRAIWEE